MDSSKSIQNIQNITFAALGAGALLIMYKGGQFLGLFPSKDDKEAKKLEAITNNYSNKEYIVKQIASWIKKNKRKPLFSELSGINSEKAIIIAKQINNAKGFFNDDEEKLFSSIREIKTAAAYYQVNLAFLQLYKLNLYDFIEGFTSAKERAKIYSIIKNFKMFVI